MSKREVDFEFQPIFGRSSLIERSFSTLAAKVGCELIPTQAAGCANVNYEDGYEQFSAGAPCFVKEL